MEQCWEARLVQYINGLRGERKSVPFIYVHPKIASKKASEYLVMVLTFNFVPYCSS